MTSIFTIKFWYFRNEINMTFFIVKYSELPKLWHLAQNCSLHFLLWFRLRVRPCQQPTGTQGYMTSFKWANTRTKWNAWGIAHHSNRVRINKSMTSPSYVLCHMCWAGEAGTQARHPSCQPTYTKCTWLNDVLAELILLKGQPWSY